MTSRSALRRLIVMALHLLILLCLLLSWLPAQAAIPRPSDNRTESPAILLENPTSAAGQNVSIPLPAQEITATLETPAPAVLEATLTATPLTTTLEADSIPITATPEAPIEAATELQPNTTATPPTPESPIVATRIPLTGGVAEGLGGRVRVTFPAQAATEALQVSIGRPAATPPSSPSGSPFEVIAVTDSGREVKSFPNPLTLEVRYDEAALEGPEESLQLRYFDESLQDWRGMVTTVDSEENLLHARLDHLTVFDTGYGDWEAARLPSLQPFQTAAFTGAATYSTELWTPPGPAGLQLRLALSYNSQVVDNIIAAQTQASWVGMGWSLETGGIERNQNGTPKDTDDDTFSFSAGGVDSLLLKGSDGYYHTTDENFWRIQYDSANDTWTAWAKDGTKYVFGDTSATRASYPANYTCQSLHSIAIPKTWRWGLHKVINIHSQYLEYTYTQSKQTHTFVADEGCDPGEYETTIWLYPKEILYPAGSPYKVVFELAERQDTRPSWGQPESYTFYMKKRLQAVRIDNQALAVRRYDFTYNADSAGVISPGIILPGVVWDTGPQIFTMTLLSVQEQGSSGAKLPATSFTYADGLHLTQATNGYGGTVVFTYDSTPWYEAIATEATESDRAGWDKVQQKVGCASTEFTLTPKPGGSVTCDDRDRQLVNGTAYLDLPDRFLQPGAVYKLSIEVIKRNSGTSVVTLGLGDLPIVTQTVGTSSFVWLKGYKKLPGTEGRARLQVSCSTTCWVRNMKWELMSTRYRVTQKSLDDPNDNAPAAIFRYRYDEPATNDPIRSVFATTAHPFTLPYSEFRGHTMTQEIGPDGRVATTFFHQDDARKGNTLVSLASLEEFGDDFEAGYNGANWQACSGSSFTVPMNLSDPLDRANNFLRGDRALRLVGDTSWRCGYRNNSGTLSDGEGLLVQLLVSGATTQAKLVLESGANQWGVKLDGAGALKAYRSDTGESSTLLAAGAFKRDTWYSLLLMADHDNFVTRVWERDNPWVGNGYYASFMPGLSWRLKLEAQNGTLWADTLSEGRFYDERANLYTGVAQPLSPNQPCPSYCFTGLGVYWVRLDADKAHTYAPGGPALNATKTWYAYDAYANRTKTQQAVWNADLNRWYDYRIEVNGYYPNTGSPYLVGLPGYTNTYKCPDGSINGACLNAALSNDLISSSVWSLYDGSTTFSTSPVTGALTGQSTLLYYADALNFSDPRRQDRQFGYDAYGNRTSSTIYTGEGTYSLRFQGLARTTTYSYDPTYNTYLLRETPPITTLYTGYTYDYNLGLPITLTGPNGPSTTITVTYDTFGRMLKLIRPGDDTANPTLQATYNEPPASARLWVELKQRIEGSQYAAWRKYYNGLGQLIQNQTMGVQVWDAGSGMEVARTLVQDTWYDAYGQVIRQSTPYSSTLTSGYITPNLSVPATLTSYDGLGRTAQVIAPDTTKTKYSYLDLEVQVTDAMTNTTRTLYDVWGRTAQVIPPPNTGPGVSYTYDTRDQLLSASRGGATTSLLYDYAGSKTWMDDPDMGEWTYAYDTLGNLTQQTDARGCLTTLHYDELNRLTDKNYTGCPTTASVSYGYDAGAYGKGQRTSMSNGADTTTWNYDVRGLMVTDSKTISGQTYTTQWGYNSADLPYSITYPVDNEVVTNNYKPQLLLNSVTGMSTYVQSTAYDEAGRIKQRILGTNKITGNFGYYPWNTPNGAGRLQTASLSNSSQTLQAFNYTYSSVGNILSLTVTDPQYNETQTYGYDALSRLTSASVTGGPANYSESYDYNATSGNLQTKGSLTLSYNDANHVHAVTNAGGNTYGYDANGNQTTRVIGGSTYTLGYDAENRLVNVSGPSLSAQFSYDGDGRRVKSVINGVTTFFVGNHYEVAGGAVTKYYYAGSSRVAMRQNGTLYYLLSDHLGSTSLTTDANGVKVAGLRYNAWGAVRYADGTTPTKYTYTGQYSYTGEFGLMFFNARWFDPALGRFAQADTIIPEATQGTQAWDRYAFVNNNPVRYNDPSGHCLILCTAIIGAAVGAIVGAVGYTAYTVASGNEFNTGHMLLAAGGGAVAGALIGTGVGAVAGISAASATSAAVTGAGVASAATTTVTDITGGDPSDELSTATRAFGDLTKAADYAIQQGDKLKNTLTGTGLQVHHIIEQRFAPALGQTASQARQWLSIAVTPEEHQNFTNAWRSAIGYIDSNNTINTSTAKAGDIWREAQQIYSNYPALLDAARQTIFGSE